MDVFLFLTRAHHPIRDAGGNTVGDAGAARCRFCIWGTARNLSSPIPDVIRREKTESI